MNPRSWVRDVINVAILSAVLVVVLWKLTHGEISSPSESRRITGVVKQKEGQVQLRRSKFEAWSSVNQGLQVSDGMSIYTNEDSSITFSIREADVSLKDETLIQVIDPEKTRELKFRYGAVSLDSPSGDFIINAGQERITLNLSNSRAALVRDSAGSTSIKAERGSLTYKIGSVTKTLEEGQSAVFDFPDDVITRAPAAEAPLQHDRAGSVAPRTQVKLSPKAQTLEPVASEIPMPTLSLPPSGPAPEVEGIQRYFHLAIGPSFTLLTKSTPRVDSSMTGLSGPAVELGGYHALSSKYALEYSFLEARSRAVGDFGDGRITRTFKLREQRLALQRRVNERFALYAGMVSQETPLLIDSDETFQIARVDSTSALLGAEFKAPLRGATTSLSLSVASPIASTPPSGTDAFNASLFLDAKAQVNYCITRDLSVAGELKFSQRSFRYVGPSQDDAQGVKASFVSATPMLMLKSGPCDSPRNLNK